MQIVPTHIRNTIFRLLCITLICWFGAKNNELRAQRTDTTTVSPRERIENRKNDTLPANSNASDTVNVSKKDDKYLDYPVDYNAADSMIISMENQQKIFLYGKAKVVYGDIELEADFIEFDMKNNTVFAMGLADSTEQVNSRPVFTEGDETFEADSLLYNFRTRRGLVHGVKTEQGGGYLHSEVTKKHANDEIHIKHGKFTTCDLDHPHFYIALSKAKVIPKEKIISGPLYLVVADIPLPIFLPFGYVPDQGKHHSGILIPSYGEENNRGFYLKDGGYYWKMSDFADLKLVGEIYSQGSWGFNVSSNYKKRYKYNGKLNVKYSKIITGEKETPNYQKQNSYWFTWNHSQDAKARPNSSFSANVNLGSSNYQTYNSRTNNDYLSNTFNSSVSYSKTWPNSPFNFSANLRHSQNTDTKMVNLTLPAATFNMNRLFLSDIIPSRKAATERKWYDKLSFSFRSSLKNTINEPDSMVFTNTALRRSKMGLEYGIPVSISLKSNKDYIRHFSVSPSLNWKGVIYPRRIKKQWHDEMYVYSAANPEGRLVTDTLVVDSIAGFYHGYSFSPSVSLSYNPQIFGMFQFRNAEEHRIKALRHVLTPSVSFSYKPDMTRWFGEKTYYESYYDAEGDEHEYSIFEGGIFGTPSSPSKSGSISFSLNNNLEMKVKSRNDTTDELRKIKILESFNLSTSYNIFAEQFKWRNISISGRTKLFNSLSLTFGGSLNPYSYDENGANVDEFLFRQTGKPFRLQNVRISMNYSINSAFNSANSQDIYFNPYSMYNIHYLDFNMPWNISAGYTYNASSVFNKEKQEFNFRATQSLTLSGGFSLTDKWKIGFTTGYDFQNNKITYTNANIYRDLHCWEMRLSFVPFGQRKSYNFQINIKSSIFEGVKYSKRESIYDNMAW